MVISNRISILIFDVLTLAIGVDEHAIAWPTPNFNEADPLQNLTNPSPEVLLNRKVSLVDFRGS